MGSGWQTGSPSHQPLLDVRHSHALVKPGTDPVTLLFLHQKLLLMDSLGSVF